MKRNTKINGATRIYRRLDAKRFVRIWQASKTLDEAFKRFGTLESKIEMSNAASRLRRRGLKLKLHPRGGYNQHNYAALARIARKASK